MLWRLCLAQTLKWLELRQMQPHSWQVFSGSPLMWRIAWYCFLHWCLPLARGRQCPCALWPLGTAPQFANCCPDITLQRPLYSTKRAPWLLWLVLSCPQRAAASVPHLLSSHACKQQIPFLSSSPHWEDLRAYCPHIFADRGLNSASMQRRAGATLQEMQLEVRDLTQ